MVYKLEKTFLSRSLRPGSLFIAILSFLFLFMIFAMNLENLGASGKLVFEENEYWRLFTSSVIHADLNHLAHNAFFFTGLALILNGYFGWFVFPCLSFLAGGLINLITISFYPADVYLVGVSGVVYFMASFWLTFFILVERRHVLWKRLVYAIGMCLIFLFPETFQLRTSYLAHGVGFLLGMVTSILYFIFNHKFIRSQEVWIEKEDDNELTDIEWNDV